MTERKIGWIRKGNPARTSGEGQGIHEKKTGVMLDTGLLDPGSKKISQNNGKFTQKSQEYHILKKWY